MEYRDRIRLDRYAVKNPDATLEPGDLVVASMERIFKRDGRKVESREIGWIVRQDSETTYTVRFDETNEEEPGIPRHRLEYVVESSYEQICDRVATAVVANEPEAERKALKESIKAAMVAERFIPAGRILSGLGRPGYDLTLFNCYVYAIKGDSRTAITAHWGRLFETFSRGGGVGTTLSILRPRGAIVRKVNGRSSGSVSWAEMFSQITGAVEQGGSRRGASLLAQWCWHPDVLEFIDVKSLREEIPAPDGQIVSRNKNLLCNTNVSVLLSNEFMDAVDQDQNWELIFPDLDDPEYDVLWNGDINHWRDKLKKKVVVYKTLRARELWDRIIRRAWESGEPGIIFMGRANMMSNSWYYAPLIGSNPCAEQPLPSGSVCNLGHLNLSKYVRDAALPRNEQTCEMAMPQFDWDTFEQDIHVGVRFLDNINDLNKYHDAENETQQLAERRIGLGILGYADALIRLGLRYGSEEALKFTDVLMQRFSETSYLTSSELAAQRGSFAKFDSKKFLTSGFMKQHTKRVRDAVRTSGMRNVTTNTIAPTGSVAAVLNTSTGCEPFFDLQYTSTTRIGIVKERAGVAEAVFQQFGRDPESWPTYVVTAQRGIAVEQHIRTQAAMQRWIDSAIAKTVNAPSSATVDDISNAYTLMWRLGCKGGTVYRDGSRDIQVLYTEPETDVEVQVVQADSNELVRPRPDSGPSHTFSIDSPDGTVHVTIRHDPESGDPIDVFVSCGKFNTNANAQAFGRIMSMFLRLVDNRPISAQTRLGILHSQLENIIGPEKAGIGPDATWSLPDAIAKCLRKYLAGEMPLAGIPSGRKQVLSLCDRILAARESESEIRAIFASLIDAGTDVDHGSEAALEIAAQLQKNGMKLPMDYCPECHAYSFVRIPGHCPVCQRCGHTRC